MTYYNIFGLNIILKEKEQKPMSILAISKRGGFFHGTAPQ